jgi:septin 3/9/12
MAFKNRVRQEFNAHGLRMYPYDSDELEDDERALNDTINQILPFAVVGSEKTANINGKQVQARQNKWGIINIEDEKHCEFVSGRRTRRSC